MLDVWIIRTSGWSRLKSRSSRLKLSYAWRRSSTRSSTATSIPRALETKLIKDAGSKPCGCQGETRGRRAAPVSSARLGGCELTVGGGFNDRLPDDHYEALEVCLRDGEGRHQDHHVAERPDHGAAAACLERDPVAHAGLHREAGELDPHHEAAPADLGHHRQVG